MPLRDIRQYTLGSLSRGKKYTQPTEYKAMSRRGFWTEKEKSAAVRSDRHQTSPHLRWPYRSLPGTRQLRFLSTPRKLQKLLGFFLIFIPVRFLSFPHTYWRILRSYSCFLLYLLFSFIHSPNSAYTIFFQFWIISSTLTLAWWICFQMLICLYCLFAFLHLSNSVFEHCYH